MKRIEEKIKFYTKDLFEELIMEQTPGSQNHTLIYGNPKNTTTLLHNIYNLASQRNEFICTMHDASKIKTALDFFEPILKAKYREEYNNLKKEEWFRDITKDPNSRETFQLSELCVMEKNGEDPHFKKLPLIFIEGIEELLFKMDYSHLSKENIKKVISGSFWTSPISKGFGNHLRGNIHRPQKGIFLGTVRNTNGIEFETTLNNSHYLFYADNFRNLYIE